MAPKFMRHRLSPCSQELEIRVIGLLGGVSHPQPTKSGKFANGRVLLDPRIKDTDTELPGLEAIHDEH